jgi:hypothetical protein
VTVYRVYWYDGMRFWEAEYETLTGAKVLMEALRFQGITGTLVTIRTTTGG